MIIEAVETDQWQDIVYLFIKVNQGTGKASWEKILCLKKKAGMMAEKERLNSTGFHRMDITVTEKHRYASGTKQKYATN